MTEKTVITTIHATVEGFALEADGTTYLLTLRWGEEALVALPLSRHSIEKIRPRFGDVMLIQLCIPSAEAG